MGRLYGFPPTAMDWFSTAKREKDFFKKDPKELQEVIEQEGLREFIGFRFSPANWRQELDIVRRRRDLVKRYAPHLYADMMAIKHRQGGGH